MSNYAWALGMIAHIGLSGTKLPGGPRFDNQARPSLKIHQNQTRIFSKKMKTGHFTVLNKCDLNSFFGGTLLKALLTLTTLTSFTVLTLAGCGTTTKQSPVTTKKATVTKVAQHPTKSPDPTQPNHQILIIKSS